MSQSRHFATKIAGFLVLTLLTASLFLAQTTVPVSARDEVPTPIPTMAVIEGGAPSDLPRTQAAAAPRFNAFQRFNLDYVKMTGTNEGWGFAGRSVLTSVNAGLTWKEGTPPEQIMDGIEYQPYGGFLDAKNAWVIYSKNMKIDNPAIIWHTTDSGRSWTPSTPINHQSFGDKMWASFVVIDPLNVYVLIHGLYDAAGPQYIHGLFRTKDGGITWSELSADSTENYSGMSFADAQFGLRTIQRTVPYEGNPPLLDITRDGGASWESRELPPPAEDPTLFKRYAFCESFQPVALSFESYRLLVGCYDNLDPHQLFTGYMYSTKNGGGTWLFSKLPEKARADTGQLFYFDAKHIYLMGKDSFQSSDDGMKWIYLKVVNWDGQFSFPDRTHGWAVARMKDSVAFVRTTNRASTWKVLSPMIVK
jgi:photosystem II stability/assembly factor-like uncharacterized protein